MNGDDLDRFSVVAWMVAAGVMWITHWAIGLAAIFGWYIYLDYKDW